MKLIHKVQELEMSKDERDLICDGGVRVSISSDKRLPYSGFAVKGGHGVVVYFPGVYLIDLEETEDDNWRIG